VVVNGKTHDVADIGVPQQPSIDRTGFTNTLKYKVSRDRTAFDHRLARRDQRTVDNSGGAHRVPVYTANGAFSRYSLANLWQHQFSQEIQAVGTVGIVDYVAGLFYFNENVADNAATPNSNTWNTDGTGYTINTAALQNPFASIDRASVANSKSYAAIRRSPEPTEASTSRSAAATPMTSKGTLVTFRNAANGNTLDKTWDKFNPMATLAYDVNNDLHVYAKYATGYRAGGASSRSPTYRGFDPETVTSLQSASSPTSGITAPGSTLPATSWTARTARWTSTPSTFRVRRT
jgi:iron complex outermembrane receptor protein